MPEIIRSQLNDLPHEMTSTTFEIHGYHVIHSLGVVRGVVVRSRSVVGTAFAGLQTIMGGNISAFTSLAEKARQQAFDTMLHQAFDTMLHQAHEAGANAVIGVRYDANEMMRGVTEVLCYGTAVVVEPS